MFSFVHRLRRLWNAATYSEPIVSEPVKQIPPSSRMIFRVVPHTEEARHYIIEYQYTGGLLSPWKRLTYAWLYSEYPSRWTIDEQPYMFVNLDKAVTEAKTWDAEKVEAHLVEQRRLYDVKVLAHETGRKKRNKTVYI